MQGFLPTAFSAMPGKGAEILEGISERHVAGREEQKPVIQSSPLLELSPNKIAAGITVFAAHEVSRG